VPTDIHPNLSGIESRTMRNSKRSLNEVSFFSSKSGYCTTKNNYAMEGFSPKPQGKCWIQEHSIIYQIIITRGRVSPLFMLPLDLLYIFPILTKSNLFPPTPFKYNYLFYLMSLLGFFHLLT
jgi:hypothetical protein